MHNLIDTLRNIEHLLKMDDSIESYEIHECRAGQIVINMTKGNREFSVILNTEREAKPKMYYKHEFLAPSVYEGLNFDYEQAVSEGIARGIRWVNKGYSNA